MLPIYWSRVYGPPLGAGLAVPWLVGAFVISQALAIIDPVRSGQLAGRLPPVESAGLWTSLALLVAAVSARAVSRARHARGAAWLAQEPIAPWRWGVAWLSPWLTLAMPVGVAASFVHPAAAIALGGTAGWLALAAGLPTRRAGPTLLATGAVAAAAAAGVIIGWWVPAAAVLASTVGVLAALHQRGRRWRDTPTRAGRVLPRRPFAALLHRDTLALWRRRPAWVVASLLASAPAAAAEHALGANGRLSAAGLDQAAVLVVVVAGWAAGSLCATLADALGSHLDPPQDPISPSLRALAWSAVPALWSLPLVCGVVAAGTGTALGPVRVGVAWLAVSTGAAWTSTHPPPRRRANAAGAHLWWLILLGGTTALSGPTCLASHAGLVVVGLLGTRHAIAKHRSRP